MQPRRPFFLKRIPEPEEMEKIENTIFHEVVKRNYSLWFPPLVDHILAETNLRRGHIVDIACGPGLLVRELARRSKRLNIIGIDLSHQAIRFASNNCQGLHNVTLKVASVYSLPFADSSIDMVVCRDSFHHFGDPRRALQEMRRVLKHGHAIYIQDLRRDLPMYLLRMALPRETVFQKLQYYSVRAAYTKAEIKALLTKADFKQLHVSTRLLTHKVMARCAKLNVDLASLRASFQAHYAAVGWKKW